MFSDFKNNKKNCNLLKKIKLTLQSFLSRKLQLYQ